MNRRDVIVVAVIIHATLLVALFAFSLKKDRSTPFIAETSASPPPQKEEMLAPLPGFAAPPPSPPITPPLPLLKEQGTEDAKPSLFKPLKPPIEEKIAPKKKEDVEYYIVKSGDNPWTIAHKHHMQVEELLRLNNMDEVKAKRLRPGDRLRIK